MKETIALAASLALGLFWASSASSAQMVLIKPEKPKREAPANACIDLASADVTVASLSVSIADAQIAYLHSRSKESVIGDYSRKCQGVVYMGFERLAKLKSPDAAQAISKLAVDPEMKWGFTDTDSISSYVIAGGIGPMLAPLLRAHVKESILAERMLNCIDGGYDTCM